MPFFPNIQNQMKEDQKQIQNQIQNKIQNAIQSMSTPPMTFESTYPQMSIPPTTFTNVDTTYPDTNTSNQDNQTIHTEILRNTSSTSPVSNNKKSSSSVVLYVLLGIGLLFLIGCFSFVIYRFFQREENKIPLSKLFTSPTDKKE